MCDYVNATKSLALCAFPPLLPPFDACIKNLTNLIKQYFTSIISVVVTFRGGGLRASLKLWKITKTRHIAKAPERDAWNVLGGGRRGKTSKQKILWQRKRFGEKLQRQRAEPTNYIFLLLLLTVYLVIVCYIGSESMASQHSQCGA